MSPLPDLSTSSPLVIDFDKNNFASYRTGKRIWIRLNLLAPAINKKKNVKLKRIWYGNAFIK